MAKSESASAAAANGSIGRTAVTGLLFVVGLFFTLSGLLAVSVTAFHFFKLMFAQAQINPLGGRLILAYGAIACSGISWFVASVHCGAGRSRNSLLAVFVALLFWSLFFLIFPGPILL